MASTYLDLTCHLIFSTKNRNGWIREPYRGDLHSYMGGVVRGLGAQSIVVGGVEDHVHLLVGLRGDHAIANVVREVKKASNLWMRDNAGPTGFGWQDGYAALSVSSDAKQAVIGYIQRQEEHHWTVSSADELRKIPIEAGIQFDERFMV